MDSKKQILTIILIILAIALAVVKGMELKEHNMELKEQLEIRKTEYEGGVKQGVNSFTVFIMDKLDTCQPVLLMSGEESVTVEKADC